MSLDYQTNTGVFSTKSLVVSIVLGGLIFIGAGITLNLFPQITLGENGQKAIQMLDAMRRPFLMIKEAETRLLKTRDVESATNDLTKAIESANSLFENYIQLAQYNPELSKNVIPLKGIFKSWITTENHLFGHFPEISKRTNNPEANDHLVAQLSKTASAFLETMNQLGEGEIPIHIDIDNGRRATRIFTALSGMFFLYLIGLIFYHQTARTRALSHTRDELIREIEERKKAEEELERSSVYLEKLHNSIGDPVFSVKLPERVLDHINSSVEAVFGYKPEECIGKSTEMFYPERKDYLAFGRKLKRALEENEGVLHTGQVLKRKNGEVFPAEITTTFLREDGKATRVISIVRDITERKKVEKELSCKSEELALMNKELHELAMEMTKVEEKEREKLAEVLHEGIGQNLVAIKIAFESGEYTSEILPLINETIQVTRSLTKELYPIIYDKLGLTEAIEEYIKTNLKPRSITVSLNIDKTVARLKDDLKRNIFRIIRECLQNTLKHASASRVKVEIKKDKGHYQIKVKDNGVGFVSRGTKVKSDEGIGLKLMREWVKSLNGRLDINSQPGKGAEISIAIPIEQ